MPSEEQLLQDSWTARVNSTNLYSGQRLPTTVARSITKLSFLLKRTGSPGGTVTFRIRRVSDGFDLGSKLLGNSNDISTSITWYEVTFDSPVEVTEQARIICGPSAGITDNFIAVYLKTSDVTAHGVFTHYSGGWIDDSGSDCTFKYTYTDISESPVVTIQAMTDIVTTTATANGDITTLGKPLPTQHGHCWNTSGTPTTADSKTENGTPGATGAYTSSLTGLTEGIRYYVRSYVINANGTFYSTQVIFTAGTAGSAVAIFPTDTVARVSSIRHIFRPSSFRMQVMLGDLGFDVDVADSSISLVEKWEEEMKRTIDDVRSYGFIPTPGQAQPSPEPIGLGPLGRAAREEQMFVAPEREPAAPRQPSVSEWGREATFPGFTKPGEPVSTAKVTEERPVTLVEPGILEKAAAMFRLRRARPVSIEEEKAKFARLRGTPKPEPVGITEKIRNLMRFR